MELQKIELFMDIESTIKELLSGIYGCDNTEETHKVVQDMLYDVLYSYDQLSGVWSMCNDELNPTYTVSKGELYSSGGFFFGEQEYVFRANVMQTWKQGSWRPTFETKVEFEEVENEIITLEDFAQLHTALNSLLEDILNGSMESNDVVYRTITLQHIEPIECIQLELDVDESNALTVFTDSCLNLDGIEPVKFEIDKHWANPTDSNIKEMPTSLLNSLKF